MGEQRRHRHVRPAVDQPIADKRKLFDINFWGVVYGCKVAVEHMRTRGGTIVNIGSEVSDHAAPLLGISSASKHAVRGYTDALRMELEHDGIPIRVSLVKPGPIDTPFPQHAPNYMDKEPKHAPPVYPPEEVAYAILKCAEKPVREITVGGVPRLRMALATIAPRLTDLMMERQMWRGVKRDEAPFSGDSLDQPSGSTTASAAAAAGPCDEIERLHARGAVGRRPRAAVRRHRRGGRRRPRHQAIAILNSQLSTLKAQLSR